MTRRFSCRLPNKIDTVGHGPLSGKIHAFCSIVENLLRFRWRNIDFLYASILLQGLKFLVSGFGLFTFISSPLPVTENSSSLIGLFITSANIDNVKVGIVTSGINNHLPVFMFVGTSSYSTKITSSYKISARMFGTLLSAARRLVMTMSMMHIMISSVRSNASTMYTALQRSEGLIAMRESPG